MQLQATLNGIKMWQSAGVRRRTQTISPSQLPEKTFCYFSYLPQLLVLYHCVIFVQQSAVPTKLQQKQGAFICMLCHGLLVLGILPACSIDVERFESLPSLPDGLRELRVKGDCLASSSASWPRPFPRSSGCFSPPNAMLS